MAMSGAYGNGGGFGFAGPAKQQHQQSGGNAGYNMGQIFANLGMSMGGYGGGNAGGFGGGGGGGYSGGGNMGPAKQSGGGGGGGKFSSKTFLTF